MQCMNNHYAKFEYKGMKTVESYRLHKPDTPYKFWMEKMSKFNTHKYEELFIECAQNRWCTSSMCEQSLCKVLIYRNENCLHYIHKPDTPFANRIEKNV